MGYILDGEKITIGTCYYPEQWPKAMWEDDLSRMLEAHITVIRIAEFAWSKVELHEGEFNFDFFDEFLDLCERKGMKVIFCTPTATPPAWLSEKYPECLNADINGVLFRHGSRRHYNYNSLIYREKSRIITEQFARHYGKRTCIIGWQLDNEFNCEVNEFHSEADHIAFRKWVKDKYGSLDELNKAWGTSFWNQTYTDFEEIHAPRRTCNTAQNPHEMLDYYRFISDSCRSFANEQATIIRKYKKPDDFITTNGMFGHLDNHALTKESLDFYMYDSYPNFNSRIDRAVDENALNDRWWSKNLSETRSVSGIFGIMEQQTGANGWNIWPGVSNPRPGQITLWTLQSIAHGADFISYFRWRTAVFGTEMYWHGILDYSGRDNERLKEVKEIGNIVKKLDCVAGEKYSAKVAVLKDYDNNFDSEIDLWHRALEQKSQDALFEALQRTHTPFDYVYFHDKGISNNLVDYDVIFYPHPIISDEGRVKALSEYVKNGGKLIICARAGQKDIRGQCSMDKLPGVFSKLTGADVKEYGFIQPDTLNDIYIDSNNSKLKAELFTDRFSDESAGEIIGTYASDYYKGDGAIIKNEYGKGEVIYYGSALNIDSAMFFLKNESVMNPFSNIVAVPDSAEIAVRGNVMFILNYKKTPCKVNFTMPKENLLTGETLMGEKEIKGYGFILVKLD